jgi:dTMP kinase
MQKPKGKIIVIEGSDGTGKETQAKLLKENLESMGHTVGSLSFPRYTSETVGGRLLHHVLKSDSADTYNFSTINPYSASLLYIMDRVESTSLIHELLNTYDFIVMDRYYTANLLHQGAKFSNITERNTYLDTIYNIEIQQLQVPDADIVFYLTLPLKVSLARMEKRRNETGEAIDQVERDHRYIANSIERGLDIAKHLGWNIIEGVEFASDGSVAKEYSKEERQEQLLQTLRNKSFINDVR